MKLVKLVVLGALVSSGWAATDHSDERQVLWTKPDDKGLSCSLCHSPDGVELNYYRFSREDLDRRASAHLAPVSAARLADLISASTTVTTREAGVDARPFQPGGRLLPGASPTQRDISFLASLPKFLPTLAGPPIRTLKAAYAARAELLELDPSHVPVGIPFSHLSEDVYHGARHASVADWFPDIALPTDPSLVAAQQAYLAQPSERTLSAVERRVGQLMPGTPLTQLAYLKYQALMLLQHQLRTAPGRVPNSNEVHLIDFGNPFWQIAEVGHHMQDGDPSLLTMPKDVFHKKQLPLPLQMAQLRLPWYWLGWLVDPSLTHSGELGTTQRGDYFTQFLWDDGPYVAHMTFMLDKRMIELAYGEKTHRDGFPRHFELQFSNLERQDSLERFLKTAGPNREAYKRFLMNSFRMAVLLLRADLVRTGACLRPESQAFQLQKLESFMRAEHAVDADLRLVVSVKKQLLEARVDGR